MRQFISMEDAFSEVERVAREHLVKTESRALSMAVGSILAEPCVAQLSIPPFDNSARDGFVVSDAGLALARAGDAISVRGELAAGSTLEEAAAVDEPCARIMTGAPVPPWASAIVMLEDVEFDGQTVKLHAMPAKGAWIRTAGSDIAKDRVILNAGRRVIAEHVQALASAGVATVTVYRRPRVGVCSTGEELVDLTHGVLGSGQIYDSNRPSLGAMLESYGCDLVVSEHVGDQLEAMVDFLNRAMAKDLDALVSSGAVSMGQYDFVKPALEAIGAEIVFHKVTQKPGKPLLFAVLPNGTLYFGLPGNPVSSTVNCRFYVQAALAAMQGQPRQQPLRLPAAAPIQAPDGLAVFLKARCEQTTAGITARALEGQESFQTEPLLQMNGWIQISASVGSVQTGDLISFYPADPEGLPDIF